VIRMFAKSVDRLVSPSCSGRRRFSDSGSTVD
jgi:hypothetical protein